MTNLTGRPVAPKGERGTTAHPRGHDCPSCRAKRNRRKGATKQRAVRKALGVQPKFHGQMANEEAWTESPHLPGLRWEVKAGGQIPKWFLNAIKQIENARPRVGDNYAPAVVLCPDGTSAQYVVMRLDELVEKARVWQEVGSSHQLKAHLREAKRAIELAETTL